MHSDTGWDSPGLVALCNEYVTWETANARPNRSDQVALAQVKARDMTTEGGAEGSVIVSPPIFGSAGGGNLPDNVTIAVKWTTGVAGRSHRGRTYHIGIARSMQATAPDDLLATYGVAFVNMYVALISALAVGTGQYMVQVSRQEDKIPLSPAHAHKILNAELADLHLDSQRRRLLGHNRHH